MLYRALLAARRPWEDGERSGDVLREAMRSVLADEPRARVDYVSVADPLTFRELDALEGPVLLSMAVFLGRARLIDNVVLPPVT